jgi:PKD repeat protein
VHAGSRLQPAMRRFVALRRKRNGPALILSASVFAASCGGCFSCTSTPTQDQPPSSLGPTGIVLDQPTNGETVTGQWVGVTGWLDTTKFDSVVILGAPIEGFYRPTGKGHGAIPTAPTVLRSDGRFIAPRVPLLEGPTTITVLPMPLSGGRPDPTATISLTITGSNTASVPATIVATPALGPSPLTVSFTAYSATGGGDWQWDFNGDGTFAEEAPGYYTVKNTYSTPGQYFVVARQKQGKEWIYAKANVSAADASQVLASTTSVNSPAALAVVPDYSGWSTALQANNQPVSDDTALTRYVLVADGDNVDVFDARLNLLHTLNGLSQPQGVAGDEKGRVYVADTGNNRVVRFNSDGSMDSTFGTQGAITGPSDVPFNKPTSIVLSWADLGTTNGTPNEDVMLLVLDQGNDRLVLGGPTPQSTTWTYTVIQPVLCGDQTCPQAAPTGLSSLSPVATVFGRENAPKVCCGTLPNVVVSDATRIFVSARMRGGPDLNVVADFGAAITSVTSFDHTFLGDSTLIAGVDSQGLIHEWVTGMDVVPELRQHQLPYPATLVAFDAWGTWAHRQQQMSQLADGGLELDQMETGPLVMWVAGAGHLERRLFTSLTLEGTW